MQQEPTDARHDDAREALLSAGAELIVSLTTSDVLPGVRAVCRTAGLPTGSFYHHFHDAAHFHAALTSRLGHDEAAAQLSSDFESSLRRVAVVISTEHPSTTRIGQLITHAVADHITRLLSETPAGLLPALLLQLTAADDAVVVVDAVRSSYVELHQRLVGDAGAGFEAVLNALGSRIREPFDVMGMARILVAVTDGFMLRALAQPGLDVVTMVEDTVRALWCSLFAGACDGMDLDELFERSIAAGGLGG